MKPDGPNNIFLTGFMGAGKSTIGHLLADLLEYPFKDLDELIVQQNNCSIAEIFNKNGEHYFRDCETKLLTGLPEQPATVYATGGGLVVRDENRRLMSNLGHVVYLQCPWQVLKRRLQQNQKRPLVNSAKGWDDVRALWLQRLPFYEFADIVIDTAGLTPLQVAQTITLELTP